MSKARQIADLLADLDNVATSGQYADLAGNPTIVSTFTNDSGYITNAALPTNVSDLTNDSNFAQVSYVDSSVAALVDSSPAALDTLNELAAALNDDADFSTTITTSIGTKADQSSLDTTNTAVGLKASQADLDTAEADIALKAATTVVNALDARVVIVEAQYRATAEITATAGQTAFAISSLTAAPTDVECFMNGIRLASSDFSGAYSSGTYTVTLGEATVVSDLIEIVAWKI